jgi:hypothetical protein
MSDMTDDHRDDIEYLDIGAQPSARFRVPLAADGPSRAYLRQDAGWSPEDGPYVKGGVDGIFVVTPLPDGGKVQHRISRARARQMAYMLERLAGAEIYIDGVRQAEGESGEDAG